MKRVVSITTGRGITRRGWAGGLVAIRPIWSMGQTFTSMSSRIRPDMRIQPEHNTSNRVPWTIQSYRAAQAANAILTFVKVVSRSCSGKIAYSSSLPPARPLQAIRSARFFGAFPQCLRTTPTNRRLLLSWVSQRSVSRPQPRESCRASSKSGASRRRSRGARLQRRSDLQPLPGLTLLQPIAQHLHRRRKPLPLFPQQHHSQRLLRHPRLRKHRSLRRRLSPHHQQQYQHPPCQWDGASQPALAPEELSFSPPLLKRRDPSLLPCVPTLLNRRHTWEHFSEAKSDCSDLEVQTSPAQISLRHESLRTAALKYW